MMWLGKIPCIILKDYQEAEAAAFLENIHRSKSSFCRIRENN